MSVVQSQSFKRVRYLFHHVHRTNPDFSGMYRLLKRCYPWPEYLLAKLLHTNCTQFGRWKHGRAQCRQTVIGFMTALVMVRIGAIKSTKDLLNSGRLLGNGELERMVDKFMVEEAQELTRRKEAKEARRRAKHQKPQECAGDLKGVSAQPVKSPVLVTPEAKSVTKQDTEPPAEAK